MRIVRLQMWHKTPKLCGVGVGVLGQRTGLVGSIHTAGHVPLLSPSGRCTRTSTRTLPPSTKLPLACLGGMIWPAMGCVRDTTRAEVCVNPSNSSFFAAICRAVVPPGPSSTTLAFSALQLLASVCSMHLVYFRDHRNNLGMALCLIAVSSVPFNCLQTIIGQHSTHSPLGGTISDLRYCGGAHVALHLKWQQHARGVSRQENEGWQATTVHELHARWLCRGGTRGTCRCSTGALHCPTVQGQGCRDRTCLESQHQTSRRPHPALLLWRGSLETGPRK